MIYKCPVCGSELVKGFCVKPENTSVSGGIASISSALVPLKRFERYKYNDIPVFRLRARVCSTCGHVDFYVHPDDLINLNS